MYKNHEYDKTVLTASSYNNKVTIEIPLESTADEVFIAFKTLMVGLTFLPKAFDDAVVKYYHEYGLDRDSV